MQTNNCRICGKTYEIFNMMVGDQTKCPECRKEERIAIKRPSTPEEQQRRQHFLAILNTLVKL